MATAKSMDHKFQSEEGDLAVARSSDNCRTEASFLVACVLKRTGFDLTIRWLISVRFAMHATKKLASGLRFNSKKGPSKNATDKATERQFLKGHLHKP